MGVLLDCDQMIRVSPPPYLQQRGEEKISQTRELRWDVKKYKMFSLTNNEELETPTRSHFTHHPRRRSKSSNKNFGECRTKTPLSVAGEAGEQIGKITLENN